MALLLRKLKTQAMAVSVYGVLLLLSPVALAEFDRGQALYENHCRVCHESWVHARDGHRITSLKELRRRVAAWSIHSGLNWKSEDIDDVTDYLSHQFYRLKEKS